MVRRLQADLQAVDFGLTVGPDRSVYVSQTHNNPRIRKISPTADQFVAGSLVVPSSDAREIYVFTSAGRHQQTLDGLTGVVRYQFGYDGAGRLTTITDRDGNVTSIERDSVGSPLAVVAPFGQRTSVTTDAGHWLSRLTTPLGESVGATYTSGGLLATFTRPLGQTSQYAYDALGRLINAQDATGAAKTLARAGSNADYSVTLTTALGRTTAYRVEHLLDTSVQLTTTETSGASSGLLIKPDGSQHATLVDGTILDRVFGPDPRWGMRAPLASRTTITTPGGTAETTTLSRALTLATPGDVLHIGTQTDTATRNGKAFTTAYDAASHTMTVTSAEGRRSVSTLDGHGRPVQLQVGDLAALGLTYDPLGRLVRIADSARATQISYAPNGSPASIIDPAGGVSTFSADADGRIVQQTLPDGTVVGVTYDGDGNLASITPRGQPAHAFAYTALDEVSAYTPPDVGAGSGQVRYAFDAERRPVRVDRADGQAVQFEYDANGHLQLLHLPSGDVSYAYDAAGRVTTLGAPTVSIAERYDGQNLIQSTWSGLVTGTIASAFDSGFRLTSETINGAQAVNIQYDRDNLITQVGALSLARSPQSGLISGTSLGATTSAFTYDASGAPSRYSAAASGADFFVLSVVRDVLARIAGKSETLAGATHSNTYSYDQVGRLTETRRDGAIVESYAYDANGNRTTFSGPSGSGTAAYDARDRLLRYGFTTFTYAPDGERQTRSANGQTTTYTYDALGNLTGVTSPNGSVDYVLDATHRRVAKRVNGALVQAWLYRDQLHPIAELDSAGSLVSRFVWAGGNTPAYMIRGGTTYRIVTDAVGSVRLVVDAATGTIAQRLDYDSFGVVTLDTNPGFQPFGFAGGLYDRDSGLVHFGARDYDPQVGRSITRDPELFAGGDSNLYAYAHNDPVNNVDPSGYATLPGIGVPTSVTVGLASTCAANPTACEQFAQEIGEGLAFQNTAPALGQAVPAVDAFAETICQPGVMQAVQDLGQQVLYTPTLGDRLLGIELNLHHALADIEVLHEMGPDAIVQTWMGDMIRIDQAYLGLSQDLAEYLGIEPNEAWQMLVRWLGEDPESWPYGGAAMP